MTPTTAHRVLRHTAGNPGPLNQNRRHQFAAQHAMSFIRRGAIYTHIPKNGCTTIRTTLALDNGAIASADDWAWINQNNNAFAANLRDILTANYTFVILRCPFARLASGFLDKVVGKEPPFWQLHKATGEALDPDRITFREFVDALSAHLHLNAHFKPQSRFLIYQDYDDWFAFERFAEATATLERRLEVRITDMRKISGHGAEQFEPVTAGSFVNAPAFELAHMRRAGQSPAPETLYDDAVRARTGTLFADDIALYCKHCGDRGLTFPA